MIFTAFRVMLELAAPVLLGFVWWHEREGWMLIPITILVALVLASG